MQRDRRASSMDRSSEMNEWKVVKVIISDEKGEVRRECQRSDKFKMLRIIFCEQARNHKKERKCEVCEQ